MEVAIIQNLQREDIIPIEEAAGYRELMETFGLTQEQVSERVGKSRPVITNAMRLLGLPDAVRALVSQGELSAGHARALLGLENEAVICALAEEIIKKGWSVRQTEAFVKRQKQAEKAEEEAPRTAWDNSTFAEVQLALMQSLSRKVRVECKKGEKKGRLVIEFYDEQDLKGLAALFDRGQG